MVLTPVKQSELFNEIASRDLELLTPLAEAETFPTGSIIFYQDTLAERVYLLDRGAVALKTALSEGLEVTFELVKKKGSPFGWSALVEPYQLTATAICLEKTRVLSFGRKAFNQVLTQHPVLGLKVMRNLCILIAKRLQRTRQLLVGQI
jgi:CRP-like cAMP-binding protein